MGRRRKEGGGERKDLALLPATSPDSGARHITGYRAKLPALQSKRSMRRDPKLLHHLFIQGKAQPRPLRDLDQSLIVDLDSSGTSNSEIIGESGKAIGISK